jgi:hypothetical protein
MAQLGRADLYARRAIGAGNHSLRIEYFENTGGALIYFTYQPVQDFDKWKGEYYPNDHWPDRPWSCATTII